MRLKTAGPLTRKQRTGIQLSHYVSSLHQQSRYQRVTTNIYLFGWRDTTGEQGKQLTNRYHHETQVDYLHLEKYFFNSKFSLVLCVNMQMKWGIM